MSKAREERYWRLSIELPFPINNTYLLLSEPVFLVLSLNYFKMLYIYIF